MFQNPARPFCTSVYPYWATNDPFPGNLYTFYDQIPLKTIITVNNETIPYKMVKGYAVIDRKWKDGDRVDIDFPYEVRKITAHQAIEDNRGKMAMQLGPLVYCAEFVDQDQPRVLDLVLDKEAKPTVSWQDSLPGGSNMIQISGTRIQESTGENLSATVVVKAIPYFAWSHRGKGEMAVWMATEKESLKPSPLQH